MKQVKESSLILREEKDRQENTGAYLPACILLLWGFFGIFFREWKLADTGVSLLPVVLISLLICTVLLLLEKRDKDYTIALLALVVIPVMVLLVFRQSFSGSLGTVFNRIGDWLYLKTEYYVNRFEESGNPWPVLILAAVYAGLLTQLMAAHLKGQLLLLTAASYAGLLVSGTLSFNIYGLLLLTGCVLALLAGCGGKTRAYLFGIGTLLATGLIVFAVGSLLPDGENAAGGWLKGMVHSGKYEKTAQAMPEGDLENLGALSASGESALVVSMDEWETLYLRGFQGGTYTGTSWEPLAAEETEEEKALLCALQKEGFYASSELAEGWKILGKKDDNNIRITNTGACSAWEYLPYAADLSESLDPLSVTGEGTRKGKTGTSAYRLYPLEESYLLMQELSDKEDAAACRSYLEMESQYRDFVRNHYLEIPEKIRFLLEQHELLGSTGISTTQACHEIRILLKKTLTYNESAVYYNDSTDFLEYMLNSNPYGYSVHYASLAVMMLRSYGIPARYVEGYYIPASQTAGMGSGETFTATQENSAAWVEYYTEGIGWLPFDPTPGHTDTIEYQMPVGDGEAEMKTGNMGLSSENKKNREQTEEEDEDDGTETSEASHSKTPVAKILLIILLILLVLLLIAAIVRTIVIRRKMKLQRERFEDPDARVAITAILCSLRGLVCRSLKISETAFFENPDGMVAELLGMTEAELMNWKRIADEVQFSRHEISEETRQEAREWLRTTEQSWHDGVGLPRRILQKYILCRVY